MMMMKVQQYAQQQMNGVGGVVVCKVVSAQRKKNTRTTPKTEKREGKETEKEKG